MVQLRKGSILAAAGNEFAVAQIEAQRRDNQNERAKETCADVTGSLPAT
jgi:hypothetical protein